MSKRQRKKAPIVEGEPDVEIVTKATRDIYLSMKTLEIPLG